MVYDTRGYRRALSAFPTGVTVITTRVGAAKHIGITANSFVSVSLDPPLVLWCIDKKSDRHALFSAAKTYTINVLGPAHEAICTRLARQGCRDLEGIPTRDSQNGAAALVDAVAVFECAAESVYEAGDHAILIGRVLRFENREDGIPLVFSRGRFGMLATSQ